MATYKEIFGKQIKFLSSDPANQSEGQIWYNSTSGTFKSTLVTEAWSSAAPLVTAIYYNVGAGTQTSALSFQGTAGPNPSTTTQTEEYDGSGWAVGGAMPVAKRSGMAAGTQTAGLSGGGGIGPGTAQTTTEEYDGTTWTGGGALTTGRRYTAGCGTQTAAICTGGQNPGGTGIADTEEYNGASWTAGGAWPKAIRQEVLLGTQTATLGSGGYSTVNETEAYEYNGTSWSSGTEMNTARYTFAGAGEQTAGLVWGGYSPGAITTTEKYDGTSWTASPASLGTAIAQQASANASSTSSAALSFGGTPPLTSATEKYNRSASVITAGAWAAGGAMNVATSHAGGFGSQTTAVSVGGSVPPGNIGTNACEEYDGSSWTVATVYPSTATAHIGATGSETAGLGVGGGYLTTYPAACNKYNGTSWTATGAYPAAYSAIVTTGTQAAALGATGDSHPASPRYSDLCNDYNGTSWTAAASNTGSARYDASGAGTATASVITGGTNPASGATEEYNGASWTTGGAAPFNVSAAGQTGPAPAANWLLFGGSFAGGNDLCIGYDGTAWSTRPSLATARYGAGGTGTATAGLAFGGREPGYSTATEEFTAGTSAVNYKTITTS